MKLILKPAKPRNPWAVAGRQRHAGAHRRSPGALRQRDRRELRAALSRPDA